MIRQISPHDARLGMYIVGFDGSWTDHPFWKTQFLLTKPRDLARLQASRVASVIIDDSRSTPVRPSAVEGQKAATIGAGAPSKLTLSQLTFQQRRAERTLRNCKQAMSRLMGDARMGRKVDPHVALSVTKEIIASLNSNPTALIGLTRIKSTDSYTFLHSIAVSALMVRFGRHLGMDEGELHLIGMAGLVHDVGKVAIPSSILLKPSGLTEAEMDLIRTHPEEGCRILSAHPDMPELVLDVCRHHHERLDGTGYPDGLADEEISHHARIAAICDIYDAVTSVRPYRKAWHADEALSRMFQWRGHLDPALLAEFARCLGYDEAIPPEFREAEELSAAQAINGYSDPRL